MSGWVGIAGIGIHIPAGRHTSAEIAAGTGLPREAVEATLGIVEKPVALPGEHGSDMALAASRAALGSFPARDLDLIVSLMAGDYLAWSCGPKLAAALGARSALAFDVFAYCATTLVAAKLARDLILADPSRRAALVASGSRMQDVIDYGERSTRFLASLSDGAGALLLVRDHPENRLLGAALHFDGSFSTDVHIPAGGAARPATEDTVARGLHHYRVADPRDFQRRFDRVALPNLARVVREAVGRSGRRVDEVALLVLNHTTPIFHRAILKELGLGPTRGVYHDRIGHMSAADQVVFLELARREGRLRDGDLVVLAGAGVGAAWGALAVEWGPVRS